MQNYIDHALDKINEIENNPYPMPDSWMEVNGYLLLAIASGISEIRSLLETELEDRFGIKKDEDAPIHPLKTLEEQVLEEMKKK